MFLVGKIYEFYTLPRLPASKGRLPHGEKRFLASATKSLRILNVLLPLISCLLVYGSTAFAASVTLTWDKNSEPDLAGYTLHWGTASGIYQFSVDVQNTTIYTISDLAEGTTYYFAATAYDNDNNQSGYSNEVPYTVPLSDTDGDGISDREEATLYGTDPSKADTDGDGIGDGEELNQWGDDWQADFDQDGLVNLVDPDSDNDGLLDGSDPVVDIPGDDPPSNPVVYQQDFASYTAGESPAEWLDTAANSSLIEDDSLFEVSDAGGDMVFGTTSTQDDIHSHYMGLGFHTLSGYEFTGRMLMKASDSGIGVTFLSQYPHADAYYSLQRHGSSAFHLSAHGTSVEGDTDSGVIPMPHVWYWFKVLIKDTTTRTEILAKVWSENSAEPPDWQVDCFDDSTNRLSAGTIGVWSDYSDPFLSYSYRRPITIDHTQLSSSCSSANISNFPLLVNITGDYLKTRAQDPVNGRVENSNGYDITFRGLDDTTCGGTGKSPCTLDHEIERYSGAGGNLVAWVRIPSLSTSSDTVIYMYYGNSEVTSSTENPTGVWDSHYKGVWHLREDPALAGAGEIIDSTSNQNHGTDYGSMDANDQVAAQIGDGLQLDGVNDYIDVGTFDPSSGDLTVSLWLEWDGTTGDSQIIIAKRDSWATGDMRWQLARYVGDGELRFQDRGSSAEFGVDIPGTTDWHHFSVTRVESSGLTKLYIDGIQYGSADTMRFGSDTNARVTIGGLTGGAEPFNGSIDEIRISNAVRDVCWIQTEYNNQSAPSTFSSCDDEEPTYNTPDGKYWDDLAVVNLPVVPLYTLTVDPADSGTVSFDPPGSTYEEGTQVVLTATANPGWEFAGWSGDLTGNANPVTITMDADRQVTPLFTATYQQGDYAYEEDFSGYADGSSPADWLDTGADSSLVEDDSLFEITDVAGDMVLSTTSTQDDIHSHYVGLGFPTLSGYEFTGRMRMTASSSGIGVTFFSQYPYEDAYYRLLRYGSTTFHVSPRGTSVEGDTDTGVSPEPEVWYRFKVLVQDSTTRTEILAKVWPENSAEPSDWQVDCYDDSPSRLTTGTIGVWSYYYNSSWFWRYYSDRKYWDDLAVSPLYP